MNEEKFTISLAGRNIAVETLYDRTRLMCRDYLTEEKPDFSVKITPEDIEREQEEAKDTYGSAGSKGYLETLAVYRKIAEGMLDYDTFLMHGAAVCHNGKAYLFIAKSGTGKTTHVRLWLKNREDAFVVNGDKPLIRAGEEVLVCGTPWSGKENLNRNIQVPLKSIIIMERSGENRMERLSFSQALPMLLQQTYRPMDASMMKKTINLLAGLNGRVSFFKFGFDNFKKDAFDVSFRALAEE